MVTASDFTLEVNELAKTLRDVVDTANGKLNFVFDDIARICTTSAVRVCFFLPSFLNNYYTYILRCVN